MPVKYWLSNINFTGTKVIGACRCDHQLRKTSVHQIIILAIKYILLTEFNTIKTWTKKWIKFCNDRGCGLRARVVNAPATAPPTRCIPVALVVHSPFVLFVLKRCGKRNWLFVTSILTLTARTCWKIIETDYHPAAKGRINAWKIESLFYSRRFKICSLTCLGDRASCARRSSAGSGTSRGHATLISVHRFF